MRGVGHRLAGGHRDVEEEVIVAGDEGERALNGAAVEFGFQQRQSELLEQQRGRGGVAVVQLVAHVQGLRHQRLQFRMSQPAHRDLHGA